MAPNIDPKEEERILTIHHLALSQFLNVSFGTGLSPTASRKPGSSKARDKLLKLSRAQFCELSTDVYDELKRRIDESREQPEFLLPVTGFHPKRNQARRKLSSLPTTRFKDIATDITSEIERRLPHLQENLDDSRVSSSLTATVQIHQPPKVQTTLSENVPVKQQFQQRKTPSGSSELEVEVPSVTIEPSSDNESTNAPTQVGDSEDERTITPDTSTETSTEVAKPTPKAVGFQKSTVVPTKSTLAGDLSEDSDYDSEYSTNSESVSDIESKNRSEPSFKRSSKQHNAAETKRKAFEEKINASFEISGFDDDKISESSAQEEADETEDDVAPLGSSKLVNTPSAENNLGLKDKDREIQMLLEEGTKMDSKITQLEAQIAQLEEYKDTSEKTIASNNNKILELKTQLESGGGSFKKQYDELVEEFQNLTAKDKELTETNRTLNDQIGDLEIDLDEYKETVERMGAELVHSREEATNSNDQLHNELASKNEKLEMEAKQLKSKNKLLFEENESLQSLLSIGNQHSQQLQDHSSTFEALQDEYNSLTQKYTAEQQTSKSLLEKISQLETANTDLKIKTNSMKDRIIELEISSERMGQSNPSLSNRDLGGDINDGIIKLKIDTLEQDFLNMKNKYEMLRNMKNVSYYEIYQNELNTLHSNSKFGEPDSVFSSDGLITTYNFNKFQIAVEEYLISIRNSKNEKTLRLLNDIVLATRGIIEQVETAPIPESSSIKEILSLVSASANHLITSTRYQVTAAIILPHFISDSAAADLSFSIAELIKMVKLKPTDDEDAEATITRQNHDFISGSMGISSQNESPEYGGNNYRNQPPVIPSESNHLRQFSVSNNSQPPSSKIQLRHAKLRDMNTTDTSGSDSQNSSPTAPGLRNFGVLGKNDKPSSPLNLRKRGDRFGSTDHSTPSHAHTNSGLRNMSLSQDNLRQAPFNGLEDEGRSKSNDSPGGFRSQQLTNSDHDDIRNMHTTNDSISSLSKGSMHLLNESAPSSTDTSPIIDEGEIRNTLVHSKKDSSTVVPLDLDKITAPKRNPSRRARDVNAHRRLLSTESESTKSDVKPLRLASSPINEEAPLRSREGREHQQHNDYSEEAPLRTREGREHHQHNDYSEQQESGNAFQADFDIDNYDIEDPDNTVPELLLYLEHQTTNTITTIQTLLQSVRAAGSTVGVLNDEAKDIINVVTQMVEATSVVMEQTENIRLKEHGRWVLQTLADCSKRMDILVKNSGKGEDRLPDKSFKQRLAGLAFDIAKSTKELVKTVEEVSLKEEIDHLENRLGKDNQQYDYSDDDNIL